jgi:hypothetical protein
LRFYDIQITQASVPDVSVVGEYECLLTGVAPTVKQITNTGALIKQYSSLTASGAFDPSALQIECDIPVFNFDEPEGAAHIKIHGVSLQDIGQSSNFYGQTITTSLGMSAGLPLAKPAQMGTVLSGTIVQAFGNWQGTNQSLEFFIYPLAQSPTNFAVQWVGGVDLGTMITQVLKTHFKSYTVDISKLTPGMVYPSTETGYYENIGQFAYYIKQVSRSINKDPQYAGVSITIQNNKFIVSDGSSPSKPKQILPTDLVGQPTWIDFKTVQIPVIMRGDISQSDYIQTPQGLITTSAASYSNLKNQTSFQGIYKVIRIRHVGNSRQPDGNSWVTIITALQP